MFDRQFRGPRQARRRPQVQDAAARARRLWRSRVFGSSNLGVPGSEAGINCVFMIWWNRSILLSNKLDWIVGILPRLYGFMLLGINNYCHTQNTVELF